MLTYSLETFTADRQRLIDSTGGVGSVYLRYSVQNKILHYRVGISTRWNTSTAKQDVSLLFLHQDGSIVPGHAWWNIEQHDVFTSEKEASEALAKFMAAGCPGLTLENLATARAREKAHKSAAKARKAVGILRGMDLDDLVALRNAVDEAIAKKTPKKKK